MAIDALVEAQASISYEIDDDVRTYRALGQRIADKQRLRLALRDLASELESKLPRRRSRRGAA